MSNQAHNCTVWLIQYSYVVDYYFMIYIAHFFALILPYKVQYYMICYFLQGGDTPIHVASRCGYVEVVEKLISSGADVNVVNKVSVNY